jgi:peptide/nickel transport system permease protein
MVDVVASEASPPAPARRSSALRRFFRHRLAAIGMFVIAVLAIGAAGAPWLAPHDPDEIDISQRYAPPLTPGHVLGSDDLGRDVLTRLLYAGQVSLSVGAAAMLVTVIVGFAVGAYAAYHGGWVNVVLMRLTDVMLCFPSVFLLLFVAAFVTPSLASISLMIGLTCWMEIARIVYAQILVLKSSDFIAAARMVGAPSWRIIVRQILPNTLAPIFVAATLNMANAILLESYISYLGYGIQPPAASWGNMLTNAQSDFQVDPMLAILPGLAITLAVTSFNLIGDGLRDALDPRMRDRVAGSPP